MYVEKIFTDDEKILQVAQLHWVTRVVPVLCLILGLATLVVGIGVGFLAFAVYYHLKNKTTEMVVTNKRVINKSGIISVHLGELRNIKVESVRLHQSIWGRIFGYGNIEFTGTGTTAVVFEKVAQPTQTMSRIKGVIDKAKNEI